MRRQACFGSKRKKILVASKDQILRATRAFQKQQIRWRRHLHRYPELSNEEFETTAFIKKTCRGLGLKLLPLKMRTGVLAQLSGKRPGPTVAIRTDIDALPVTEQTGLAFRSKNHDRMHACGHDMHMATVLGTAAVLQKFRDELNGCVRFIFQPAEEMPPGGAAPMIENGALKNVSMIFGLHVDPRVPTGRISLRDGVTMASVLDFDLIVHGKGGHAARPHDTVDAIAIAAEVIESIQKVVSREIDPISPVAITFGMIEGGIARNVVCDRVKITGTARALTDEATRQLPKLIKRCAAGVCRARGARLEMNILAGYPPMDNHSQANEILAANYARLFGRGRIATTELVLGGEDFAWYLKKTKGAMFRLGIKNKKIKADKPWHSPQFIADEAALHYGTALLTASVLDCLSEKSK